MGRYNKIYAGPVTDPHVQVDEVIATAVILPGCFFTLNGALATAATNLEVLIAQENYLLQRDTFTPYAIGELVVGMKLSPTQMFNARVAATTVVTKGTALALGANGQLVLATANSRIVAFSEETFTVGATADLVRVRPAVGFRQGA